MTRIKDEESVRRTRSNDSDEEISELNDEESRLLHDEEARLLDDEEARLLDDEESRPLFEKIVEEIFTLSEEGKRQLKILTFSFLFFTNLQLFAHLLFRDIYFSPSCIDHCKSKFAGITFDTPVTYHAFSEFWNPDVNQSMADKAWDDIDTSPLAVALHDDYVKKMGLGPSTRFPWDTQRSVYYLKGYHDLHCLKLIRKALLLSIDNQTLPTALHHILHCFEGLRQDIMCAADDTPMPALGSHGVGEGQVRQCRDWDKMTKWATRLDQNACYKLNDYREATNTLELFAFCPEGSPYKRVMEAYFEFHGHLKAYGEQRIRRGMRVVIG